MLFMFYAYRSLKARARANALTMLAIMLLVAGATLGLSFYEGLREMLVDATPPENVVVLAKAAVAETDSRLALDQTNQLMLVDGVQRVGDRPLAVRELITRVYVDDTKNSVPVFIRGVDELSAKVHRAIVVQGAAPAPGSLDLMMGQRVADEHPSLKIGSEIKLPAGAAKITGIMTADGGPVEDEIWTPRSALELHLNVKHASSMTLVARDVAHVGELVDKINTSREFDAQAISATKLLADTANLGGVATLVITLLALLSIVATFAIATTIDASAAVRMPELAALAAIGIPRRVLGSVVLMESALLAIIGALLGVGLSMLASSQIGAIRVGSNPVHLASPVGVIGIGVGIGVAVALAGAITPAVKVARLDILKAIR
jgi:putative ABC transport system permease protein